MQCAPLPTPTQEKRPARSTGASATGGGKTRTSTSSAPSRPSCCSAPPPSTVSVWPPWPEFGRTEMTTPTIENTVHPGAEATDRSEEHTSELQSLMRISYAVFCLKKKTKQVQQSKKTESKQ